MTKKHRTARRTYRMQIFLATLLVTTIPTLIFAAVVSGQVIDDIQETLQTGGIQNTHVAIFDETETLVYATDEALTGTTDHPLKTSLHTVSLLTTEEDEPISSAIQVNGIYYDTNTVLDESTGWRTVRYLNNSIINTAYLANIQNFFILLLLVLALDLLLALLLSRLLTVQINELCRRIDNSKTGQLELGEPQLIETLHYNVELTKITDSYNHLNERLHKSLEQNYRSQLSEKQLRFQVLRAQTNPHFLYNTFNLISSLGQLHHIPEVSTIAIAVSDLLRYNLKAPPIVTLQQELDQVQRYLDIQSIRFPHKFQYEWQLSEELLHQAIPSFILQPLVENSILHGFSDREEECRIVITGYAEDGEFHLLVSDNGEGISPARLIALQATFVDDSVLWESEQVSSIGLLNVYHRLRDFYADGNGLSIISTEQSGTLIEMILPMNDRNRSDLAE